MNTTINIDLREGTCDVMVQDFPLRHINDLSAIKEAVAENLRSTLVIAGMDSAKAHEGVNLLLQGELDIQSILKEIP